VAFDNVSCFLHSGFKATPANLLSVPVYAWACLVTCVVGFLGDRIGSRGYINLCVSSIFLRVTTIEVVLILFCEEYYSVLVGLNYTMLHPESPSALYVRSRWLYNSYRVQKCCVVVFCSLSCSFVSFVSSSYLRALLTRTSTALFILLSVRISSTILSICIDKTMWFVANSV
jgi:hypothetical protein